MIDIALLHTDTPYLVTASRPQGLSSRWVARHRVRFVQPGLNAAIAIAARTPRDEPDQPRGPIAHGRLSELQKREHDRSLSHRNGAIVVATVVLFVSLLPS